MSRLMSLNRRFRGSLVDLAILGLLSGRSSFLLHNDRRAADTVFKNNHFRPLEATAKTNLWFAFFVLAIAPESRAIQKQSRAARIARLLQLTDNPGAG